MPRLFSSIRVAPGIRLSTTSRGLRAHMGPRGMRLHVGGGRSGVSTGAGPFTVYESLGGTSYRPAATPTDRAAQARLAQEGLRRLYDAHRAIVAAPRDEVAGWPELPKFQTLLATAEKQELKGVSRTDRQLRKEATARARTVADGWALGLLAKAHAEHQSEQQRIDRTRAALQAGEPEVTMAALRSVFDGNGSRTRVVSTSQGAAAIVVRAPGSSELPEMKAGVTAAGAATVVRLNKTELADNHRQAVASAMLLAAKQAFALGSGLRDVRVVAIDGAGGGASAALVAATLSRGSLERADFSQLAWPILEQLDRDLVFRAKGRARELQVLDLTSVSAYADLAGATC